MNPLDNLSWEALLFLSERTDFSEPWNGIGFPTTMQKEINDALQRKANMLDKNSGDSFYNDLINKLKEGINQSLEEDQERINQELIRLKEEHKKITEFLKGIKD